MLVTNIYCLLTSIPYENCWFTEKVILLTTSIGWIPSLIMYSIVESLLTPPINKHVDNPSKTLKVTKHPYGTLSELVDR